VATANLLADGSVARVLVVDCDVHQGDGTADIFRDDGRVFTLSLHAAKNFPARKIAGDLDVELSGRTEDGPYLEALAGVLDDVLSQGAARSGVLQRGRGPAPGGQAGTLALTDGGLAARDAFVLEACRRRGAPVAGVIGGGLRPRHRPAGAASRDPASNRRRGDRRA
jgi:acetoin utilization deacetylase AcuC-like enzyme